MGSENSGAIGTYLDPMLVDNVALASDEDIGLNPSWGAGTMSLRKVPLLDGRIAEVDENGIIVNIE